MDISSEEKRESTIRDLDKFTRLTIVLSNKETKTCIPDFVEETEDIYGETFTYSFVLKDL